MKNIIEFIKQPHTTTLLAVVGLTGGFFIGIAGKFLLDTQITFNHKKDVCNQAYEVMCLQVHACTGSPVEQCDSIVKENNMCDVNLPDVQVIYSCKNELRHIECTDNLPTSCSLFME
jgi:hypothetical protein